MRTRWPQDTSILTLACLKSVRISATWPTAVDTAGNELYTVVIKDLHTGTVLREAISGTWTDVEWANDNQTIFYTVLDAARRPSKLFRHRLCSDPHHDVLVYEEGDAAFRLRLSKTRSKAYLLLQVRSLTSSEVHRAQTAQQTSGNCFSRGKPMYATTSSIKASCFTC